MATRKTSHLPSGYVNIAIENGPFIVDLPIRNCDFRWLCVELPDGMSYVSAEFRKNESPMDILNGHVSSH